MYDSSVELGCRDGTRSEEKRNDPIFQSSRTLTSDPRSWLQKRMRKYPPLRDDEIRQVSDRLHT